MASSSCVVHCSANGSEQPDWIQSKLRTTSAAQSIAGLCCVRRTRTGGCLRALSGGRHAAGSWQLHPFLSKKLRGQKLLFHKFAGCSAAKASCVAGQGMTRDCLACACARENAGEVCSQFLSNARAEAYSWLPVAHMALMLGNMTQVAGMATGHPSLAATTTCYRIK